MKGKNNPVNRKVLLWWVAIISLAVCTMLYFLLKEQAQYDAILNQRILMFPLVGIIIAGICIIAGTAGRWFYPK